MKLLIALIKQLLHRAPPINKPTLLPQEICPHKDWVPETRENGWRSYCVRCLIPAAGSCQG
ncbi:hypothetical protein PHABIO_459 [Pseudomonas phage Phabio]|uniref:Uncharacterized protein n=1 Tax=Pseudomonas phage Phabio TaxID=2006668 RepID=A0A1Y0T2J6_9CAUD|nr:hypothetical protein MZD05_gp460 [Pseudomonas phage Phabio]ARV77087.1 hypothetical protein PHABIO_459 [Pseudomonas phage Phabio]